MIVPAFGGLLQRFMPFRDGEIAPAEPHQRDEGDLLIWLEVVDGGFQFLVIRVSAEVRPDLAGPELVGDFRLFGKCHVISGMEFVGFVDDELHRIPVQINFRHRFLPLLRTRNRNG